MKENKHMCYDVIGKLEGCKLTYHALDEITKDRKLLRDLGIDDKLLCYCIERVCKYPGVYHREEKKEKKYCTIGALTYTEDFTLRLYTKSEV